MLAPDRPTSKFISALIPAVLGLFLSACAARPKVALDPNYVPSSTEKVARIDFTDYPAAPGSGEWTARTFERYLLGAYEVAPETIGPQPIEWKGGKGLVLGMITDFSDFQEQTFHTHESETRSGPGIPCYERHTSRIVAKTVVQPARVGLSVKMVDAATAQVLWAASTQAEGDSLDDATRQASYDLVRAVGKKIRELSQQKSQQARLALAKN